MTKKVLCLCLAALFICAGVGCKKDTSAQEDAFRDVPLETLLEQIYDEADIELPALASTEITAENAAYYLGTDGLSFTEGIASEALINVVPFSLCLIRVENADEAEQAARTVAESADPNKWICVGVSSDQVITDYAGDVVILIMAEQSEALAAAFRRLAAA